MLLLGCRADPFLPPAAAAALGAQTWQQSERKARDVLPMFFATAWGLLCIMIREWRTFLLQCLCLPKSVYP